MPKRTDIHKIMVIGSGPIIIGQAAEFDYAGSQACAALREEGYEVILINSNPATIMTDTSIADKVYMEPLTLEYIAKILRHERPDAIVPGIGGQTGLNMAIQLEKKGILKECGVELLGTSSRSIERAEDRELFKELCEEIGEPVIPSEITYSVEEAVKAANDIGYPVVLRPAFTLGGTGGGFANNEEELIEIAENGFRLSPVHQVLVEKSVKGYKEIEFEVMRDSTDHAITICGMENVDPVGVHTGDSIVVAPIMTLNDHDLKMLNDSALKIIRALQIEGGCNVQFALDPNSSRYFLIEVNPRVSRSSALASKASGYPIARVTAKIAVGMTLEEIAIANTNAAFEPSLDYVVAKMPRFPFDKFTSAPNILGTQMKATGEVMAIGTSFESAIMKAVSSIELGLETLTLPTLAEDSNETIVEKLHNCDSERAFVVYEALKRGISWDVIHDITKIDRWFLAKMQHLADMENALAKGELTEESYRAAKQYGFLDKTITRLTGKEIPVELHASYKMVDTCAAEFAAKTPYFYASFDEENEAEEFIRQHPTDRKKVMVFGSGPIRIGQGIEFDYCSVHCVWTLKENGCETILVNNNPETVSTDFDTGDRLYFDPLNPESVAHIIHTEKPWACVVQFGGQTAIKLTKALEQMGVKILGTSADAIDEAEDRERFDALLERCGIPRPAGETIFTCEEALEAARRLGYPVLLRPSYVLGGQNMIIAYNDADVTEYMGIITSHELENPVLVDKYLTGVECEVDAICDGEEFLIPGIMEHIERAGIHSGDSISVYPPQTLPQKIKGILVDYTGRLAKALKVVGLVNIQYVVHDGKVYVIEVNPRSSRTVPYISKVTGVPVVELAVRCLLGEKLSEMGFGTGLYPTGDICAVKVPVFSFEKLHNVDTQLGPEMKSTGEVLGIGHNFEDAMLKGLIAAGYQMRRPEPEQDKCVLLTVKDSDKEELIEIAYQFKQLGYKLYATAGTANWLAKNMIACNEVRKISEEGPNILNLLESGRVDYVLSTSSKGRLPSLDSVKLRRKAVELSIPCLTAIDTANVLLKCLQSGRTLKDVDLIDISKL